MKTEITIEMTKSENQVHKVKKQRRRNNFNAKTTNEERMRLVELVMRTNSIR